MYAFNLDDFSIRLVHSKRYNTQLFFKLMKM